MSHTALSAPQIKTALAPHGRVRRLREMYWRGTYRQAVVYRQIAGCGEDTLTGHAADFATLLAASDPFIQPGELIVGTRLAVPASEGTGEEDRWSIDLGYYNPHYPPGYATLLRLGLPGLRDHARARLETEVDPHRREFLRAVEVAYDAACDYVVRYATHAAQLADGETDPDRCRDLHRIAAVCRQLATGAPASFHAALQLVQFTRVLGGRGCIGRLDQWLHPFYARDLAQGQLTQDEAQELLECAFLKMNEFGADVGHVYQAPNDDLRNIALAGQTPDGQDACNELTYMCLEASAKLMLPEPKLNVRFYPGTPRSLLRACCRVLAKGDNVLAIFNDEVVIPALSRLGIPLEDARDYCNDGCSELIIGGKGTIWFRVHDALSALRETVLRAAHHPYATFDEVVVDFKSRLVPFMPQWPAEDSAVTFPFFAATVEDCLAKASPTGARYSIYGSILAEVANVADGLATIQKLIYEDGTLTWDELVAALEADFVGFEPLRQRLRNRMPKYGNDDDTVDRIAADIAEYFCEGVHERAHNPTGAGPKWAPGLMCFGIHQKSELPASPDGRRQGDPCANSFSPAVGMDRSGPTAVLQSVAKVDLTSASHGSVLDIAFHSSAVRGEEGREKLISLVEAFLDMPCTATLQVNVVDRETLLRARQSPDAPEFRTLIVRVWGFSAVFVELPEALQDHVLARTEHGL
jgi:formate C-acetyltransferase